MEVMKGGREEVEGREGTIGVVSVFHNVAA